MSDRAALLKFIETHYDMADQGQLALSAGINVSALPDTDSHSRAEALLRAVEQQGTASLLLTRMERDYPSELPSLEWAGARAGQTLDEALVQERSQPTNAQAPPEASAPFDRLHARAPLLGLRDGIEQLEQARSRSSESSDYDTIEDSTDYSGEESAEESGSAATGVLANALAQESQAQGRQLPFRFVHGYTLPKHWARRDAEIAELVAEIRDNNVRVLSLIAIGGTGKSALTRKLLDELPEHNVHVDGALWFSFYVEPDFDRFLTEVCRYLIPDFDPVAHPSPYEKGVLLREAMEKGHYLLVLDGIEVLLASDRTRKDFGSFLDRAMREFLESVCEGTNSQVLISARWPPADLVEKSGHKMLQLADLSLASAENLLDSHGVIGTSDDRMLICARFGSHALTLQVLADYLTRFHAGSPVGIADIQEVDADATQGILLQSALNAYWQRLLPEERFFLTRMSAFRGGVDERSFPVLSKNGDVFNPEFRAMVTRIIKSPLVSVERRDGSPRLTAHPLIKTFFYERMGDNERDQTHRALKDYAQGLPLPDRPHTLPDYEPLLEACHHCLQVGLYTEAYLIYRRNNMDNALRWWGHYAQAYALLEPLRDATRGESPAWQTEPWQKSWVENETALLAMLRGEAAIAVERFHNSAVMDADAEDAPGESASWQNMASVLIQRGDLQGALEALQKSETLEAHIGRYEKEDLLLGLKGICYSQMGQVQTALEHLSRALGISLQKSSARAACYWTWRIGDLYLAARQAERALIHYDQALETARHEQFKDYEGHALNGLANASRIRHETVKARRNFTDALRIARSLGNPYLENEVRLGQARLAEDTEKFREAEAQAHQTLDRAEECGYQVQGAEAHLILARCAAQSKETAAQSAHLAAARKYIEQTGHYWTRQELEASSPVSGTINL